jgi:hypothetical protein
MMGERLRWMRKLSALMLCEVAFGQGLVRLLR